MSPWWRCFLWRAKFTPTGVKNFDDPNHPEFHPDFCPEFMETIIVGLIALALFVYLFIAMVYPEKF
jgi:K+-transporting ATPase KdpF subunit